MRWPWRRDESLRSEAHDAGDGDVIYHCFEGSTEFLTPEGRKTLAETVGTSQMVLANTGSGGTWVEADIRAFGEQRLWEVILKRNGITKVIRATDEHRWFVRRRRTENREVLTKDLQSGQRLAWLLPRSAIKTSTPSPFGIAHGITFGDGTRAALGSTVNLWGEKDAQLLRWFSESRTSPIKTPNGVEGIHVMDLPAFFKDRPSLSESIPYLYGWLSGYFAADGCVSATGTPALHSSRRENLEFVEAVCLRLGVATYPIRSTRRIGYGSEATDLWMVSFVRSTLRPDFFLIQQHRERYEGSVDQPDRLGWTVDSVRPTDESAEVYCAVVPGVAAFTLADYIYVGNCYRCGGGNVVGRSDGTAECGFCKAVFTVQVQPTHPYTPQTIDGRPYDNPEMPGEVTDPTKEGTQPQLPPGNEPAPGSESTVFHPPGAAEVFEPPQQVAASKKAAYIRLKSEGLPIPEGIKRTASFRTALGDELDEDAYVKHLSIRHAEDRASVLEAIRAENEA